MNEYISLDDLKLYIEIDDDDGSDDPLLEGLCYTASRMIDGTTRRFFYPKIETRDYDHPQHDDGRLKLDGDLLVVDTFTTNNGDTEISASDYFLMTGTSYNLPPYERIVLKRDGTQPNLLYSGTIQKANQLIATWGYHEDYDNAWQSSNDVVKDAAGISAAVTSITVDNADGADIYGNTPRFKTQTLLKIDDEFISLVAKDTTTNILTVIRGVNGSTAASHALNAPIYIYQPEADIHHAARRLAGWLYAQKDTPYSNRLVIPQAGTIEIPSGAPIDVMGRIAKFIDRSGR